MNGTMGHRAIVDGFAAPFGAKFSTAKVFSSKPNLNHPPPLAKVSSPQPVAITAIQLTPPCGGSYVLSQANRQMIRNPAGHLDCSDTRMTQQLLKSPFRQRTEKLQERTFEWAARILDLCPRQYPDDPSRSVWRQLIRAAPSASCNLEEADEAFTDHDFLYRMKLVLRETKEARRWLRFIQRCKLARHQDVASLEDEARQLAAIFATIYIKRKKSLDARKAPPLRGQ